MCKQESIIHVDVYSMVDTLSTIVTAKERNKQKDENEIPIDQ